jgi:hypothetical protein
MKNSTIAFGMAVAGLALGNMGANDLIQNGVDSKIVQKASNYLQNLDPQEMEKVIEKANKFPAYLNQKIKELGNEEEILN